MNTHSRAIIQRTLSLINSYRNRDTGLSYLVRSLEGSLNALEEKMPEEFYNSWFSFWGDLETILALGTEAQAQKDIIDDLEGLEKIINKQLSE